MYNYCYDQYIVQLHSHCCYIPCVKLLTLVTYYISLYKLFIS